MGCFVNKINKISNLGAFLCTSQKQKLNDSNESACSFSQLITQRCEVLLSDRTKGGGISCKSDTVVVLDFPSARAQ